MLGILHQETGFTLNALSDRYLRVSVTLVFDIVAVFSTVLIDDTDTEHIPDDITPVVKSAFGNIYSSADVIA